VEEANYPKQVSVLMAAWNEQAGIERAVRRIFAYPYPFDVEVVVVDDGSTDNTPQILARLAGEFCQSPHKLVVLTAQNGGKAKALNRAILTGALHGAVTVMIDGDTLVDANTIPYLVRHFGRSPRLGAVAGRVGVLRIGKNPWQKCLIRWQLAKYNMDIGVTRMAQAVMGAILIVPGACCAYSTPLLVGMGGFRTDNLAEDAEVGVLVRWHGYEVRMDLDAVAYTETPIAFKALCRQQFRWAFGIYQVIFKHSRMMAHPVAFGPLAWFVMPYTLVSTILPLIVLPVNLIVTALAMTTHNWSQLLIYYAIFTAMQVILSVAGMISLREWSWDPVVALYFRPINDTIQLYVACRSIKAILLGRSVGWGSVPRVGDAVAVAAMSQSNPETAEA
jgi:biofilm PGA synthesis N-glycosyltransferase PgaC